MELERHFNHDIVIARYSGLDDEPVNYAVECETCNEVIIDEEVEVDDEPWGLDASKGYSLYGQETGLRDSDFI